MERSANAQYLGWDISFQDKTNNIEYTSDIVEIELKQDAEYYPVFLCTIKFSVDTSFSKYFIKKHEGTLTLTNKLVRTNDPDEMFIIELESVTNFASILERAQDTNDRNITLFTINYMCKQGILLNNSEVGGIFEKKKIEDVIRALYNKAQQSTNFNLPLDLEPPTNGNQYEFIHIPNCKFVDAIRYLDQNYGIYDNMMFMYGNTFISDGNNGGAKWRITNINKHNSPTINLFYTPYEQSTYKAEEINKKTYYTYYPIIINNNISKIAKLVPQMFQTVSFDNDKFIKRKDVLFEDQLCNISFQNSIKQFKEDMEVKSHVYSFPRLEIAEYALKGLTQKIGINAYGFSDIYIPSPYKLSHFKIGTVVNMDAQTFGYTTITSINLLVLGWNLKIRQGNGFGGGGAYTQTLKLRSVAISYL